ncbi:MAG: sensor domain-containing diguanylate cyclase [Candidatus Omnitrophota bacterium]
MIKRPKIKLHRAINFKDKTTIGAIALAFFFALTALIMASAAPLTNGSPFYINLTAACLAVFGPLIVIIWYSLGSRLGMTVFSLSCLVIMLFALRAGIQYFNSYVFIFFMAALLGNRAETLVFRKKREHVTSLERREEEKNVLVSQLEQKQRSGGQFESRYYRYKALKDTTEKLSSTLELDKVLDFVVEESFRLIGGPERVFLFLVDETKQELDLRVSKTAQAGQGKAGTQKWELYDTWILKNRKPLLIEDIEEDFRFSTESLVDPGSRDFKAVVGAPLVAQNKVIGVLRMDSRQKGRFSQDDLRLLSIIVDLSAVAVENALLYKRTNELAIKDGLTELYLHRYFKERLAAEAQKAHAGKRNLSVLMVDIDFFKDYNDRFGHAIGDVLLKKIALLLTESVSEGDVVARYGGEEFAVLLIGSDLNSAIARGEEIRHRIENRVFMMRRQVLKITVSVGVASLGPDGTDAEKILARADSNLYKAKAKGRNTVWPKFC